MGGDCAVIRRRGGLSWFFNGTLGWDKENADIDHTSTVLNTQINIHDDDWWEVASLPKWKRRHSIREVPLATDITQKTFHQKGNFSPKNHCYRRRHNRKSKKDRIFPWLGFLNPSLIIWISLGADHRHHVKQNMDWWVRGGRKQQRRSKSWGRHNIWQTHRVQRTHADDGADDDNMKDKEIEVSRWCAFAQIVHWLRCNGVWSSGLRPFSSGNKVLLVTSNC